ncbi:MAG: calcium-binding protein [Verrucomicrobiota bacterium]
MNLNSVAAVLDGNGAATNVVANALNMVANTGIGSGTVLETQVANFNASNHSSGNTEIENTGNVTVSGILNAGSGQIVFVNHGALIATGDLISGGAITVTTDGAMTIHEEVAAIGSIALTVNETGLAANTDDFVLSNTGSITSTTSNITLLVGDDATIESGSSIHAAGNLFIGVDLSSNDAFGSNLVIDIAATAGGTITIFGGPEADLLDAADLIQGAYFEGRAGDDDILGGSGPDVVLGQAGDDEIFGGSGTDLLIGGDGSDDIFGNDQNDVLVGDDADNQMPGSIATVDSADAQGDTLNGGAGDDVILGGLGADQIDGGADDDVILGDSGVIYWTAGVVTHSQTTDITGSDDVLDGGTGDNVILGGLGSDTINAANGDDIILADQGSLTFDGTVLTVESLDTANGGDDQVDAGAGNNLIIAGAGADDVNAGVGNSIVLGDNGVAVQTSGILTEVQSTALSVDGADTIVLADGDHVIFGGAGSDEITSGQGDSAVLGDNGIAIFLDGLLSSIETVGASIGGDDTITLGAGANLVIGGYGADHLSTGAGQVVAIGDNGKAALIDGILSRIETILPNAGADDVITAAEGLSLILGGFGADDLTTGGGTSIVLGDDGFVTFTLAGVFNYIETINPEIGAVDTIVTGDGSSVVLGGADSDRITSGNGSSVILGDNGRAQFTDTIIDWIETSKPIVGGNDTISAADGTNTILGGFGDDDIDAGEGAAVIVGDNGRAEFVAGVISHVETTDSASGGADTIAVGTGGNVILGGAANDVITTAHGNGILLGDNGKADFLNGIITQVATLSPEVAGDDIIETGDGNNLVFGGSGGDRINTSQGNSVLFGDSGLASFVAGIISHAESTDVAFGGADTLISGNGDTVVLGGAAGDAITAADGAGVFLGDNGSVDFADGIIDSIQTTTPDAGGDDLINIGNGENVALGGFGNDRITAAAGTAVLAGDNGSADFDAGVLVTMTTTDPGIAGADDITGGALRKVIFGGSGEDRITTNSGNDVVLGDNGVAGFINGVLRTIETIDESIGAIDVIDAGEGSNVVIGGMEADVVTTGAGSDVVLGDNGKAVFDAAGELSSIETETPATGGNDRINSGNGSDIVLGGAADDTIDTGSDSSRDLVLGDNGRALFSSGDLLYVTTTDPAIGGVDVIEVGEGSDIVLGGAADDQINLLATSESGDDIFVGDNGQAWFSTIAELKRLETSDPAIGGSDTIAGQGGNDVIFGGAESDVINGNDGDDILVGDSSVLVRADGSADANDLFTTDPDIGGNDQLHGDNGDDIVIGGAQDDTLTGDLNNDRLIGDNARVIRDATDTIEEITTIDPGIGGDDQISGNEHNDIALGGVGSDLIHGNDGEDYLAGDNGRMVYTLDAAGLSTLDLLETTDPTLGTDDQLFGDAGEDVLFGGAGCDELSGGTEDDVLIGDEAQMVLNNGEIQEITSTDPSFACEDILNGDDGSDVIVGGSGRDTIHGYAGHDVLFGDNGRVEYLLDGNPDTLDLAVTIDPNNGDDDVLYGDDGNDLVFGGTAKDTIYGGSGDDVVFGDHGRVDLQQPSATNFLSIDTGAADGGHDDVIYGDDGDDILIGGQGNETIYGGAGDDDVIGGHNAGGGIDQLGDPNSINDRLDGGTGNDFVVGDNAIVTRRGDAISVRIRLLSGATLYTSTGAANVGTVSQAIPTGAKGRDVTLLDGTFSDPLLAGGKDIIAGGAGDDTILGGPANDVIQGDGDISIDITTTPSTPLASDGDDYVEGNGGDDLIVGGLGQDDLIGGSSDLFGLNTATLRADGSDTIYGGARGDLARNTAGDTSANGHSRDADMIIGDNGRILRPVKVTGGASAYLTFNYDNYAGATIRIIPRVVTLLDYTPGTGAVTDRGASDTLHGEAGDDSLYGAVGNDFLFGEAQDDDLYGGAGDDWMSGGAGEDGMLGDDGRIMTSRNGLTEPLYGLTAANAQTSLNSGAGSKAPATAYQTGLINKAVDLEPFDQGGNDTMYGGLGNDFMHGGMGDDGMSGAEALANFYSAPSSTPPLVFNQTADGRGTFALYNAQAPLSKIANFWLNFEATDALGQKVNDGNDVLFGDYGHDWLVGGTNSDHLYGGWGNDLMNADDNLETTNGLNTDPDGAPFNEQDIAFGGAGLDVLLAGSKEDRLYDWSGEYNTFAVPFKQFGEPTITRAHNPSTVSFLYALSKADGADQTRTGSGLGSSSRNGEPFGELGLLLPGDDGIQDQHGKPRDPQPGSF